MDYPNDVISLKRTADIIEGYFSLSPEYRDLILKKIAPADKNYSGYERGLDNIKKEYLQARDKIRAIRDVRALLLDPITKTTLGLKEAKDLVESWY